MHTHLVVAGITEHTCIHNIQWC